MSKPPQKPTRYRFWWIVTHVLLAVLLTWAVSYPLKKLAASYAPVDLTVLSPLVFFLLVLILPQTPVGKHYRAWVRWMLESGATCWLLFLHVSHKVRTRRTRLIRYGFYLMLLGTPFMAILAWRVTTHHENWVGAKEKEQASFVDGHAVLIRRKEELDQLWARTIEVITEGRLVEEGEALIADIDSFAKRYPTIDGEKWEEIQNIQDALLALQAGLDAPNAEFPIVCAEVAEDICKEQDRADLLSVLAARLRLAGAAEGLNHVETDHAAQLLEDLSPNVAPIDNIHDARVAATVWNLAGITSRYKASALVRSCCPEQATSADRESITGFVNHAFREYNEAIKICEGSSLLFAEARTRNNLIDIKLYLIQQSLEGRFRELIDPGALTGEARKFLNLLMQGNGGRVARLRVVVGLLDDLRAETNRAFSQTLGLEVLITLAQLECLRADACGDLLSANQTTIGSEDLVLARVASLRTALVMLEVATIDKRYHGILEQPEEHLMGVLRESDIAKEFKALCDKRGV